jgi:hypothetical protein
LVVSFNPVTNAAALAAFRAVYGLPANVPIFGPYEGKFDNAGEEVKLNRPDAPQGPGSDAGMVPYILTDLATYSDRSPWPTTADGFGSSLQRRRPHDYGNDPVNWKGAAPSPGRANVSGAGFTDADHDGMPDSYETARGFLVNNPADATQDADGDGRLNYEEFLDGTDPFNFADRLNPPSISVQPQAQVIPAGSSVSFSVMAEGSAPLSYQWRFNGVSLVDATNATLVLSGVKLSDAGEYAVVVRNPAGFTISTGVPLSVNQPLEILAQPQSRIIDIGGNATFNVFAVGSGTLSYQWRFNGADLPGATAASFTVTNAQPADSGNYSVFVSDSGQSLASAEATLSVLSPPTIVQQPQSHTAVAFNDTFFSVTAGGQGPFSYQWRFNGVNIPGAIGSILPLPNVQPNQAGTYRVEVFNPVSSTVSSNAVLTLLIPAAISQHPQSTNVAPGATVTFSVAATSSTPISYQWRFNDVDIPGATGTTLTLTNVQEEIAGNYLVVVTDGIGSVRSEVAVLGVIIPLAFVYPPLAQSVVQGGSVTFSVEIKGSPPPYGFEWRKNSTPLVSNALHSTKSFFTISNTQPADAGGYRAVVRNVTSPFGIGSTLIQLTVLPDFDKDGLPDVLEASLGLNTNDAADAVLDLDGDGVSNRNEYIGGTDPADPASYLWIGQPEINGGAMLWFSAMANKTYTVQYSDDLSAGSWLRLDDVVAWPSNHLRSVFDPNAAVHRTYRVVTPRQP